METRTVVAEAAANLAMLREAGTTFEKVIGLTIGNEGSADFFSLLLRISHEGLSGQMEFYGFSKPYEGLRSISEGYVPLLRKLILRLRDTRGGIPEGMQPAICAVSDPEGFRGVIHSEMSEETIRHKFILRFDFSDLEAEASLELLEFFGTLQEGSSRSVLEKVSNLLANEAAKLPSLVDRSAASSSSLEEARASYIASIRHETVLSRQEAEKFGFTVDTVVRGKSPDGSAMHYQLTRKGISNPKLLWSARPYHGVQIVRRKVR